MIWHFKKYIPRGGKREYLFKNITSQNLLENQMIFCTGMGRSGTHFLSRLIGLDKRVASYHLDEIGNPIADSFYQFAKWYNIDIDLSPLLKSRKYLASEATKKDKIYFESNPYLNLHVGDLLQYLPAKILVLYRDPKKVVESHYNKGWYKEGYTSNDMTHKVPGFDYSYEKANHFFGRFQPNEPNSLKEWEQCTQIGKIAWMWAAVYTHILKEIKQTDNLRIIKVEDISYKQYIALCNYLTIEAADEITFQKLVVDKPGKAIYREKPEWNPIEINEFHGQVDSVFDKLERHKLRF